MPAPRNLISSFEDIDVVCYLTATLYKLDLSKIDADTEIGLYTDFYRIMEKA
jgi:hypothetical protein